MNLGITILIFRDKICSQIYIYDVMSIMLDIDTNMHIFCVRKASLNYETWKLKLFYIKKTLPGGRIYRDFQCFKLATQVFQETPYSGVSWNARIFSF